MYLVFIKDENDYELFNKEENAINAFKERMKIVAENEPEFEYDEDSSVKSYWAYKNGKSEGFFALFKKTDEDFEEEIRVCLKKIDVTDL